MLTVTLPAGADPTALGFGAAGDEMARRVEAHLRTTSVTDRQQSGGALEAVTFVAETRVTDALPDMVAAVREWNRRYAHPKIVVGGADDLTRITDQMPATIPTLAADALATEPAGPDSPTLLRLGAEREQAGHRRIHAALTPVAALMTDPMAGAEAAQRIGAAIDTQVPGYLILNPSPFRRTDVVVLPDGRLQLVTDVPAMGYAFVLDEGVAPHASPIDPDERLPTVEGGALSAELDPATGAIRSLRYRDHWRQWAAGRGLNAADASMMERGELQVFPGVGARLVAQRYSPYHGAFSSSISMYDALPWIDIENRADAPERPSFAYGFDFALEDATVRWEIPAGHAQANPPLRHLVHLRWLAVDSPSGSLLFRGVHTPYVTVAPDARLDTPSAGGVARYRLLLTPEAPSVADCSTFGWSTEPLGAVAVSGNGGSSAPRFGTPFVLDQADAAILGVEGAADAGQVTLYIQNMAADARLLTLGFGLLAWTGAHRVDFRGREIPEAVTPVPDGVGLQAPPWGVVAVRLDGLRLRVSG
ncbi:MAG: hypothetical protein IH616_11495 [Gemmatimonadales bacterium]|nr:hypothetical protein [Gemmatimonadales bacterium]